MFDLDLRRYVDRKSGQWSERPDAFAPSALTLFSREDEVTLRGPVCVNVAVVAQNQFFPQRDQPTAGDPAEMFSYDLEIPAGHSWTYRPGHLDPAFSPATNAGWHVIIRPCKPRPVCPPTTPGCDVPCDYAVADCPDSGQFFPVGCEPCRGTTVVNVPPGCSPSLSALPAAGGCVRPHYFNGMFITAEDLETHLRYGRLKQQLQNRAMGEGVVWGLNVGLDGSRVAVGTGYGVDCCGNDLTVATCYRVDIASLLCDPAAVAVLRQEGPHRMHLLLEYIECLQDARPVHGDPCRTTVDRCEMSRVRETVRLRLVPPRDLDTSGPIADFLKEVSAILPKGATTPTTPPTSTVTPPDLAPFHVGGELGTTPPATISLQPDRTRAVEASVQLNGWRPGIRIKLSVGADSQWSFGAGSVLLGSQTVAGQTPPFTGLSWDADPLEIGFKPPTWVFANWRTTSASDPAELSGTTTIRAFAVTREGRPATPNEVNAESLRTMSLRLSVTTTIEARAVERQRFPCLDGNCAIGDERRFEDAFSLFLHEHPTKPGQAAEPAVYTLAATYALLVMTIARFAGNAALQQLAPLILANAVRALFGQNVQLTAQQIARLIAALQRLFISWCKAFLYPGPHCRGEPHGVVIGCAVVAGGTIQRIDPWGGRRWVVHYPLLTHWGSLFGLKPLDVLIGRVASFLCCLAGLPPFEVRGLRVATGRATPRVAERQPGGGEGLDTDTPTVLNAGSAVFAFGAPARVAETLRRSGIAVREGGPVSLPTFAMRLIASLQADAPPDGARFVRHTLESAPEVSILLAEERTEEPETQPETQPETRPKARPAALAATPASSRSRLVEVVRAAQARARASARVQPLARGAAEDIAAETLHQVPIAYAAGEEEALTTSLEAAGIATVADALERDPEALLQDALGDESAAELSAALTEGSASPAWWRARSRTLCDAWVRSTARCRAPSSRRPERAMRWSRRWPSGCTRPRWISTTLPCAAQ